MMLGGGVLSRAGQRRRLPAPTDLFSSIFGRTELIIGASKAKNRKEFDDEVRFLVRPPKSAQKGETRLPRLENFVELFFFRQKLI